MSQHNPTPGDVPKDPVAEARARHPIGSLARTVWCRGHIRKAEAGRLVTIRAYGEHGFPGFDVRVDDGDPSNDDPMTNGARWMSWLPWAAIEPMRSFADGAR
jgi:hypothetical protein